MTEQDRAREGSERLEELLADRAMQGLSPAEHAELERLLEAPERALAASAELDADAYERAAAALDLALDTSMNPTRSESMPVSLRQRIIASAPEHLAQNRTAAHADERHRASAKRTFSTASAGWWVAAAAGILALFAWWPRAERVRSLADLRQALIDEARDEVSVSWKPTDDPDGKNVAGDVVWSSAAQKGFLRFAGLPTNDAAKAQYQLWIFDADQDDRYPIDGGVFDIDRATGEVIIPIDAKIRVSHPKMFAVTVEKPGGVVVSSREHIVAIAQI